MLDRRHFLAKATASGAIATLPLLSALAAPSLPIFEYDPDADPDVRYLGLSSLWQFDRHDLATMLIRHVATRLTYRTVKTAADRFALQQSSRLYVPILDPLIVGPAARSTLVNLAICAGVYGRDQEAAYFICPDPTPSGVYIKKAPRITWQG